MAHSSVARSPAPLWEVSVCGNSQGEAEPPPGMEGEAAMSDPAQPPDLGAGPQGGESSGGPPKSPPNLTSNRRLQQSQAEVDQVVDILRDTVNKAIERDVMISSLDDKADSLHESAKVFENSTTALARKYWCQNMKMMIILGVICGIVVIATVADGRALYRIKVKARLHSELLMLRSLLLHLRLCPMFFPLRLPVLLFLPHTYFHSGSIIWFFFYRDYGENPE